METVPLEEITVLYAGELAKAILGSVDDVVQDVAPEFIGTVEKENLVFACFDLSPVEVMAYEDGHGQLLFKPQERSVVVKNETGVHMPETATTDREPRLGSPIHAWRTLGLIDAEGVPTRRGEIFSFFQHGEGLAIVAALEDESYPADDLAHHLANLRVVEHGDADDLGRGDIGEVAGHACSGVGERHHHLVPDIEDHQAPRPGGQPHRHRRAHTTQPDVAEAGNSRRISHGRAPSMTG
jgi:hypothetical protein